jgi:hypothetical protein
MPGVDRVAGDLVGFRLLEEPAHAAVGLGLDEAVGLRVLDRREHDRRLGLALAVEPDDGPRSIWVSTSPLNTTTDSVSDSPA